MIDIEIHLKHDPEKVRQELQSLANELEKHYKKKPIFYVTYDTYEHYVKGYFKEYDLWIRDIFKSPTLENRETGSFGNIATGGESRGLTVLWI